MTFITIRALVSMSYAHSQSYMASHFLFATLMCCNRYIPCKKRSKPPPCAGCLALYKLILHVLHSPKQESAFLYFSLTSSVHKSEGFLADVCKSIAIACVHCVCMLHQGRNTVRLTPAGPTLTRISSHWSC